MQTHLHRLGDHRGAVALRALAHAAVACGRSEGRVRGLGAPSRRRFASTCLHSRAMNSPPHRCPRPPPIRTAAPGSSPRASLELAPGCRAAPAPPRCQQPCCADAAAGGCPPPPRGCRARGPGLRQAHAGRSKGESKRQARPHAPRSSCRFSVPPQLMRTSMRSCVAQGAPWAVHWAGCASKRLTRTAAPQPASVLAWRCTSSYPATGYAEKGTASALKRARRVRKAAQESQSAAETSTTTGQLAPSAWIALYAS